MSGLIWAVWHFPLIIFAGISMAWVTTAHRSQVLSQCAFLRQWWA
ncbi:MAG: hypothetical protein ACLVKR_09360 [Lachnospiraceae bacterium]